MHYLWNPDSDKTFIEQTAKNLLMECDKISSGFFFYHICNLNSFPSIFVTFQCDERWLPGKSKQTLTGYCIFDIISNNNKKKEIVWQTGRQEMWRYLLCLCVSRKSREIFLPQNIFRVTQARNIEKSFLSWGNDKRRKVQRKRDSLQAKIQSKISVLSSWIVMSCLPCYPEEFSHMIAPKFVFYYY